MKMVGIDIGRAARSGFATPEGRVLLIGLTLALVYAGWLGSVWLLEPARFDGYLGMTISHLLFGRAAGMAFGYALEYGHGVVIPVNMAIETVVVLIFYPVFVAGWEHLLVFDLLRRFMHRVHEAARANRERIRRFGIAGLALFVFFPFWMTGPLVGCVLGYLLGLRTRVTLVAVLGGTYLAIVAWGALLKGLRDQAAGYGPYAPLMLVVVAALVVVIAHLLDASRRSRPVPIAAERDGNEDGGR